MNIASTSSTPPYPAMAAYAVAKAGIAQFTQTLAVYLAPYNIRVNSIAPGIMATPGTSLLGDGQQRADKAAVPLRRCGYSEDVAFAAIYLASDAADFVTGTVLTVNGGPYLGGISLKLAEETWKIKKSR